MQLLVDPQAELVGSEIPRKAYTLLNLKRTVLALQAELWKIPCKLCELSIQVEHAGLWCSGTDDDAHLERLSKKDRGIEGLNRLNGGLTDLDIMIWSVQVS